MPTLLKGPIGRLVNIAKLLYCKECDYQFTVTANTIFHDSHLPLIKWFTAVYLLCESRKGMSANQIKRTLGVSYKTAWYLCHRIRAAMATAEKTMLYGTVEMDETYVGGKLKGQRRGSPHTEQRDRNRHPAANGELRFFHAEDAKTGTLAQYIKENVSEDVEVIMTDEYNAYPLASSTGLDNPRDKHKTIKHKAGSTLTATSPRTASSPHSRCLKRGIIGSWHKVSAKHLAAYLEEMTFRFNRRNSKTLFLETLQHMITADPLSYSELTGQDDALAS